MTEETARQTAGFLGLCTRAGQLLMGQEACVNAVRRQEAALALLDEDSSENTRKRMMDACSAHQVPLYGLPAGAIARAVGKDGRRVAAIKPGSMARKFFSLLEAEEPLTGG